jgi:tRNA dimethylallyltransferase
MMSNNNTLICIIGPTAIGKTALSLELARYFKTEILSADSRQFYKELNIGTAAPSPEQLAAVKHHFIHHLSITADYSVGSFEKDAIERLEGLFKSHEVVIMVGGSGLYVDAVTRGLDHFPKVDDSIRKVLNKALEIEGLQFLQEQLKKLDRNSYTSIAIDNPRRVIRALEVCLGTGRPFSSFKMPDKVDRPFNTITIGLQADRQILYDRIDNRVDQMMKNGLLQEVKSLYSSKSLNALNTVGYKELFKYLDEEWTLEFAISEIKKNSRRFAKRQLTWFKKDPEILWFDYKDGIENITRAIEARLTSKTK